MPGRIWTGVQKPCKIRSTLVLMDGKKICCQGCGRELLPGAPCYLLSAKTDTELLLGVMLWCVECGPDAEVAGDDGWTQRPVYFDPAIAVAADRTMGKWERFKRWLLYACYSFRLAVWKKWRDWD